MKLFHQTRLALSGSRLKAVAVICLVILTSSCVRGYAAPSVLVPVSVTSFGNIEPLNPDWRGATAPYDFCQTRRLTHKWLDAPIETPLRQRSCDRIIPKYLDQIDLLSKIERAASLSDWSQSHGKRDLADCYALRVVSLAKTYDFYYSYAYESEWVNVQLWISEYFLRLGEFGPAERHIYLAFSNAPPLRKNCTDFLCHMASLRGFQTRFDEQRKLELWAYHRATRQLSPSFPSFVEARPESASDDYIDLNGSEVLKGILDVQKLYLPEDNIQISLTQIELGLAYAADGKPVEAARTFLNAAEHVDMNIGLHIRTLRRLLPLVREVDQVGEKALSIRLLLAILRIVKETLGDRHPMYAKSLSLASSLYYEHGDHVSAFLYSRRAIGAHEVSETSNTRNARATRERLAKLYHRFGYADQSKWVSPSDVQKPQSPDYYRSEMNERVLSLLTSGQRQRALALLREAARDDEKILVQLLWFGLARTANMFLKKTRQEIDQMITLSVGPGIYDPQEIRESYLRVMARKGFLMYEMMRQSTKVQSIREEDPDAPVVHLAHALASVREEIARRTLQLHTKGSTNSSAERIVQLKRRETSLQAKIYARLPTEASAQIEAKDIQEKLSEDSVLLDYYLYRPLQLAQSNAAQWGSERYAVALVDSERISWYDLGDAKEIDKYIKEARKLISLRRWDDGVISMLLYERLLGRFLSTIRDKKSIIISPDGTLGLLPFEILQTREKSFILENFEISYVAGAQDLLLDNGIPRPFGSDVTVFADIDFGSKTHACWGFGSLPGTREEILSIQEHVPAVRIYRGEEATESIVKKRFDSRVIHIASHGFSGGLPACKLNLLGEEIAADSAGSILSEDVMSQSGLALAKVNDLRRSGSEDGVLTAREVLSMDLHNVDLVVLSSCASGMGRPTMGEGIIGMRQAMRISGAASLVVSLWDINDDATAHFMDIFYREIGASASKAEALKTAKMEMLGGRYSHPYNWAGMILVGDSKHVVIPKKGESLPAIELEPLAERPRASSLCRANVGGEDRGSNRLFLLFVILMSAGRRSSPY